VTAITESAIEIQPTPGESTSPGESINCSGVDGESINCLGIPPSGDAFLAAFRSVLLADVEASVSWQTLSSRAADFPGSRFAFRVSLPYVCVTDMISYPPNPHLEEIGFELAEDMEDFCPITYLAFKREVGCYAVGKAHLAARGLGLTPALAETLMRVADEACPDNPLYLALQEIFLAKAAQTRHQEAPQV
jgi:hypothetical protein